MTSVTIVLAVNRSPDIKSDVRHAVLPLHLSLISSSVSCTLPRNLMFSASTCEGVPRKRHFLPSVDLAKSGAERSILSNWRVLCASKQYVEHTLI